MDLENRPTRELLSEHRALAQRCLALIQVLENRLAIDETSVIGIPTFGSVASDSRHGYSPATRDGYTPLITTPFMVDKGVSPRTLTPREPEHVTKYHAIFPNPDQIKKKLRGTLKRNEYMVENLYHDVGWWQFIAKSGTFQNFTMVVIALNSLWIAVDTDMNKADLLVDAKPVFQVVENAFCVFFSLELFTRFMAFRNSRDAFRDAWFTFDFVLVALMVWETWIGTAMVLLTSSRGHGSKHTTIFRCFRLFRLLRASRVARLLKFFPELMLLIQAMISAMRAVGGTVALLVTIIYIFAILFTQLMAGTGAEQGCFESVPRSMNCLMGLGVFPDQKAKLNDMLGFSWLYFSLLLVYLTLATLTVMNLLIGVLCEVVDTVAQVERETMTVSYVKGKLSQVVHLIDVNGDANINRDEYRKLLDHKEACLILDEVGIDVYALVKFADQIFGRNEEISFDSFIEKVFQFKGDKTATVKDIVDMRKFLHSEITAIQRRLSPSSFR